jgi:hypothetical protein
MRERPNRTVSKSVNTRLRGMRPEVAIGSDLDLSLSVVVAVSPNLLASAADFGMDFGIADRTLDVQRRGANLDRCRRARPPGNVARGEL